ncbi:hypothetical protein Agub_g7991, partial [Astrephomene gubernaculifera]
MVLQDGHQREHVWKDVHRITVLAGPILVQYVVSQASQMVEMGFVGHLPDPLLLSAMTLGASLAMATGYHLMYGLASASETLSGQAHGARNPCALAATLHRSLAVCAAAAVPVTALWWNAGPLLRALGQQPEVAAMAARYLRLTLPALYGHTVFSCIDKHLLAQGVVAPGVAITATATALSPLYCWFFIVRLGLQLDGAAYAYNATQLTCTSLSLAYLAWRTWASAGSPDAVPLLAPSTAAAAALSGWGPYLALAVPDTLMACMEGWATEVLVFLSGHLPHPEIAVGVTGLCLQLSTLVWICAAAVGAATTTRVSNTLGQGDATCAKRLSHTALGLVLVTQTVLGLLAYGNRWGLMGLMSSQSEVLALAGEVMPVLALCFVFDGQNVVLSGILRGAG